MEESNDHSLDKAKPSGSAGRTRKSHKNGTSKAHKSSLFQSVVTRSSRLLSILAILAMVALFAYRSFTLYAQQRSALPEAFTIKISKGSKVHTVANLLEAHGAITSQILFIAYIKLSRASIKHGEYEIPAHSSLSDIVKLLSRGKTIVHEITFPEGLTSYQFVTMLNNTSMLYGEPLDVPEEGSLFPDTYHYVWETPRADLLAKMRRKQTQILDQIWNQRDTDTPFRSKKELLVLASIIEKEANLNSERSRVASVFLNRLRKHMRLQSDATVLYGITLGRKPLDRKLTLEDLRKETPYNTYKIEGLPYEPICSPGYESLYAAAHPEHTPFLFFMRKAEGGHSFAATFEEHKKNVMAYKNSLISKTVSQVNQSAQLTVDPDLALALLNQSSVHDASDGTPFDPLVNLHYDLTTSKVVPNL